jgi:hypothetical protein
MKGNAVRIVLKPTIGVRVNVIIIHQMQELCRYDSDCGSGRTAKEMIVVDVKAFTCVG